MSAVPARDPGSRACCAAFSREFACLRAPRGAALVLLPMWFADRGPGYGAEAALRCALEYLPGTADGADGACESAGAMLHLQLADDTMPAARQTLAGRLTDIVLACVLERQTLPCADARPPATSATSHSCIRDAASWATAQVLEELDDTHRVQLERIDWRTLPLALHARVQTGYARARTAYADSALAHRVPALIDALTPRLRHALRHDLTAGARVTLHVDPARGALWFESTPAA